MVDYKAILSKAPQEALDGSMKLLVKKWDSPPKAVQVLEVLDKCSGTELAGKSAVRLLQLIYDEALEAERTTHHDVVELALWRRRFAPAVTLSSSTMKPY
jgi:hypothetical protein